ncbi:hypothetical protein [Roseateles sp.]|uniref:hypothetical protein n=1 Tax=Roseateles sp. TaxID=1971397 RepID=UPI00326303A2
MPIFKSDAQGFIIGERLLDAQQSMLAAQNRALPVWREIRRDVRAIVRQLGVQTAAVRRVSNTPPTRSVPMVVAEPAGRRSGSRPGGTSTQAAPLLQRQRAVSQPVALPQRGAGGRFTAAGGKGDGKGGGGVKSSGRAMTPRLARIAERLERAGANLGGATENLDPTLNAAKEVRAAIAPIGRGLGGLFGRNAERKKERWYQRIWKALSERNKSDKKAAANAAVPARGGLLGTALSAGASLGGGVMGLLRKGGGLLRRVPLLGALLSGGLALGGAFGMNDDPSKSAEENRSMRYRSAGDAAGMGLGGVVGGVLGSVLGPLGTLGGAWLGGMIGEKLGGALGDWSKSMIDAKVPEKVVAYASAAWDSVTGEAKAAWSVVTAKVGSWAEAVGSAATAVNERIKQKTGVDVAATAKGAWNATKGAVSTAAGAAVDFTKQNAGKLVPETVKRAAAAGERAVGDMMGISKVVETGAGYNVVQRGDGSVVRQEGARNWRNNNPGNIEFGDFAKRHGATGSDGRFAIFPTYEAGRAAQEALFFDGKNYKNLKLSDAIARWAPPSENNTTAYQAAVLGSVGGRDRLTSEYTPEERRAIMDAKQRVEGFKVGTVRPMAPLALPSPVLPSVPTLGIADLPKAPEIQTPATRLNSGHDDKPMSVSVRVQEKLGQDVPDRALAHICSGGIGGP